MLGLPDVAAHFQSSGFTALLYDPRSTGLSDGQPRNDIDPTLQVSDYCDALTFLAAHASVDPTHVFLWGMSFAATVALCAASLDKRARAVIAVCPLTDFTYTAEKLPQVLAKCMQDRASQVAGNEPMYLPMLNARWENPAGFGLGIDAERYGKIVHAGKEIAPRHVNRTTMQSYFKMVMWQPFSLWRLLAPTPVMFVVPELDRLSPAEVQLEYFAKLDGPKRLHVEKGVGHLEIMEGLQMEKLIDLQVQFLRDVMDGKVKGTKEVIEERLAL